MVERRLREAAEHGHEPQLRRGTPGAGLHVTSTDVAVQTSEKAEQLAPARACTGDCAACWGKAVRTEAAAC